MKKIAPFVMKPKIRGFFENFLEKPAFENWKDALS
jgi:hypothetical protein